MRFLDEEKQLFDKVSLKCSRLTTTSYSTSFSLGILFLDRSLRDAIYSIYGFVRFADEIVDSFHHYDQRSLLDQFENETYKAIHDRISLNPIINSFQHVVNQYDIPRNLIDQFLLSMRTDLTVKVHDEQSFKSYVLGSAEVVGLMCLKVFCKSDVDQYETLQPNAMRLGAAFQKINFLRDVKSDFQGLGRVYFPGVDFSNFDEQVKRQILNEIENDFQEGLVGIKKLPRQARFGVYLAYTYYRALYRKVMGAPSRELMARRIRVASHQKFVLLVLSFFRYRLSLL